MPDLQVGVGQLETQVPDAIASLYSTEAPRLRAFARKRTGDADGAEDLVQEAFRILSDRWRLEHIHNPSAFLLRVLQRQINSLLRERYRRRLVPLEQAAGHQLLSAPDVVEQVQSLEEQTMVRESIRAIHSQRQKRVLLLTGLDLRPGEIARLETEAGRPSTSHQISCVLRRGLANLRLQVTQRGLMRSFVPGFWLAHIRGRTANGFSGANWHRVLDGGLALQLVVGVTLAGIFGPSITPPGSARPVSRPAGAGPSASADQENVLEIFDLPETSQEVNPLVADQSLPPEAGTVSLGEPKTGRPSTESTPLAYPSTPPVPAHQPSVSPQTEISHSPDGFRLTIQPAHGEEFSLSSWEEASDEPAPPLLDQTEQMIENPDTIPRPECGGLPVCSDPEGDDPPEQPRPN